MYYNFVAVYNFEIKLCDYELFSVEHNTKVTDLE